VKIRDFVFIFLLIPFAIIIGLTFDMFNEYREETASFAIMSKEVIFKDCVFTGEIVLGEGTTAIFERCLFVQSSFK